MQESWVTTLFAVKGCIGKTREKAFSKTSDLLERKSVALSMC